MKIDHSVRIIKISVLYIILLGGGIWHVLDMFQTLMNILAAPILISLGIWLFVENARDFRTKYNLSPKKLSIWSLLVIIFSIFLEGVGVKTGVIFGDYVYGSNLSPYIRGVPVSIGFAWLTMLLSSGSLAQYILPKLFDKHKIVSSLIIALLMMVFDIFMEPAAMKLGYWNWISGYVPVQNYVAWFVTGFFFAYIGFRFQVFSNKLSEIGIHVYLVQILYHIDP